jgi:hypothetical protein
MVATGTHSTFADILALARPEERPICQSLRRLIESLDSSFVELVWPKLKIASFGVGPRKKTQHYAYIAVQRAHINLGFYHGASLPDPTRILEGAGKELRHVKLCGLEAAENPAVATLMRKAIAERKPYRNEA